MNEIDHETITTDAGDYTVTWFYYESAEQPYNEGLGFAFVGNRHQGTIKEGEHAEEVLTALGWQDYSSAVLARWLRIKYGLKGIREVSSDYRTSEPDSERFRAVYGLAWAPDDVPDEHADRFTDSAIEEWRAWADGDTFGWVLNDPAGNEVSAVWGYYGFSRERDYTLTEAIETAKYDAAERIKAANLAGSGFVGLIL